MAGRCLPRPTTRRASGAAPTARLFTVIGLVSDRGTSRRAPTIDCATPNCAAPDSRAAVGEENFVSDTWVTGPPHKAANSGHPDRVTDANDFAELLQPPVSTAASEHNPTRAIAEEKERGGIR